MTDVIRKTNPNGLVGRAAPAEPDGGGDWAGWETWIQAHLASFFANDVQPTLEQLMSIVGEEHGRREKLLRKQIRALEQRIAVLEQGRDNKVVDLRRADAS